MRTLKEYAERFFSNQNTPQSMKFVTRLGEDWAEEFPSMSGINAFSLRLLKAFALKQRVCIFSDYDTDAVCATSVLYWSLVEMGFEKEQLGYYAPDRFVESYGLNLQALKNLAQKYDLIITVDCGINSLEEAEFMQESQCDLIITDHHQVKDTLPNAQTVLNPQIESFLQKKPMKRWQKQQVSQEEELVLSMRNFLNADEYLQAVSAWSNSKRTWSTSLVGASVIWLCMVAASYRIQDLLKKNVIHGIDAQQVTKLKKFVPQRLERLLSFVSIATLADCQSVVEPMNRTLVIAGLKQINSWNIIYPGLEALLNKAGFGTKIEQGYKLTSLDVSFVLSPILNASGRIAHASLALDTMCSWKRSEAETKAAQLLETNQKRKEMVVKAMQEIGPLVSEQNASNKAYIFVKGRWSKGIVGLIASRITAETGKVSFVASTNDSEVAGSARAPEGWDLVTILKATESTLSKFGGHAQAAGFTIQEGKMEQFSALLNTAMGVNTKHVVEPRNYLSSDALNRIPLPYHMYGQLKNILYLDQDELAAETIKKIFAMDPFGQDFPQPLVLTELKDYSYRTFGKEQEHIKIEQNGMTATLFFAKTAVRKRIGARETLWVLAKASNNFYRGVSRYEVIIEQVL